MQPAANHLIPLELMLDSLGPVLSPRAIIIIIIINSRFTYDMMRISLIGNIGSFRTHCDRRTLP